MEQPTRICTIEGCESPHVAKGMCSRHYQQVRRRGAIWDGFPDSCVVMGCESASVEFGICADHMETLPVSVALMRTGVKYRVCQVSRCDRDVYTRGYCSRHYQQMRIGYDPAPERELEKASAPEACTVCGIEHDGSSGLMSFCSRRCYYRSWRLGHEFEHVRECVECGAEFSLLDKTRSGRSRRTNTTRCEDCCGQGGYWCMTAHEIAERDGWRCAIGGEMLDPSVRWPMPDAPTVDHIIPRSRGGEDTPSNLQLACARHNLQKSNKLPSEMTFI